MINHYILVGREVRKVYSLMEWGRWFESANRVIAQTFFPNVDPWKSKDLATLQEQKDRNARLGLSRWQDATVVDLRFHVSKIMVSTVFLGIDHGFNSKVPILFETMVFHGPLHDEMERYATYDEAEAGHKAMVEKVKAALIADANYRSEQMEGGK